MAKKKTRDDFREDTKRRAADRVNGLCSMCFRSTKAASAESSKGVSNLGVAAHICAAAPGPGARRYDPSQTPEERSSIENCIWLCQYHAKLIDTDEITYSKAYLLEKKKTAETIMAKALADGKTKIEIIKSAGFGIAKTKEILQEKAVAGDFIELKQLLDSMEISEESDELSDLHDYYGIVHAFYCDRAEIETKIEEYKKKATKGYASELCELFAQHFEAEYLAKVIDLCTDETTKKIAMHVINGTVDGGLIKLSTRMVEEEEQTQITLIARGSFMHKLATNFAAQKGIRGIVNPDGSDLGLYDTEFVYKMKKLILDLAVKTVKNLNLKKEVIEAFEEYKILTANLEKIKLLAPEFQTFIFARMLIMASNLHDNKAFDRLYAECCAEVRENLKVKEVFLYEKIMTEVDKVDFTEVRKLCEVGGGYDLANTYLNKLMDEKSFEAEKIINSHQFLFSCHSMFLKTYIRLKKDIRQSANFAALKFLNEYKERYKDDPAFHIYLAFYINAKKHKKAFEKEVEWLDKNINYAKVHEHELNNLSLLIAVYSKAERYDKLLELDAFALPNYFRLSIASALHNSKRTENIKQAKRIYMEVLEQEPTMEGLCRSLFGCCYSLGEIQEAKEYTIKEIVINGKKEDYLNLLQLRYETNDTAIDEHIEKAKEFQDQRIDHIIGGFYLENDQKEDAKKFLLRSLLVDDSNTYCMNGYMSAVLGGEKVDQPKKAGVGVTAQLKDQSGKTTLVAIHEESAFPKNNANKFAKCSHHKESDKAVEDLLLAKVGDEITYRGTVHTIESLNWNEVQFHGFIMSELVKQKRVMTVQGETTEQLIERMTEILREQSRRNADVIKKYNESETAWPTTLLARFAGKGYLATYSFLFYENKKKFKNLHSVYVLPENPQFVLSFETIYALAIFDIDGETLKAKNCLIPISVKRKMTKEVDELIANSKDDRRAGTAMLVNDKFSLAVPNEEQRKASLKFYNRMKRMLDEIPVADQQYSYLYENDIKKAFAEHKMFMESDLLGCVHADANRVLVGDDPFLSAIIMSDRTNAIGMNRFLAVLGLDLVKHLECVKQLARMNYGNYFTVDVYERIKGLIYAEQNKEAQDKLVDAFVNVLASEFIDAKAEPELWKHNNAIVRDLAIQKNMHQYNDDQVDRILLRANVYNFSKEQPEEYKKRHEEIAKSMCSRLVEKDGKMYIETWIESGGEPQPKD